MAGAFTHMALVAEAMKNFPDDTAFGKILIQHESFVVLGAVSPDIPYLSQLNLGIGASWADIFHYHQTNGIVQNGLHSLMVGKASKAVRDRQIAWLAGFTSHLVADATIHPIVEAIVGPCTDPDSKKEHTKCEMIQDVMIVAWKNMELTAAEHTRHIDDCIASAKYFKPVIDFWAHHAMVNCPHAGLPDLANLIGSYTDLLSTAEGGNNFAKIFRHVFKDYTYQRKDELDKDDIEKYYSAVVLPNKKTGNFEADGFDYAARNIVNAWTKIEKYLFTKENIVEVVPNWNLDTGYNQSTNQCTFWS